MLEYIRIDVLEKIFKVSRKQSDSAHYYLDGGVTRLLL